MANHMESHTKQHVWHSFADSVNTCVLLLWMAVNTGVLVTLIGWHELYSRCNTRSVDLILQEEKLRMTLEDELEKCQKEKAEVRPWKQG
jgi:hypothetical protein